MVITLIGYRGSGKTAAAERLAASLGWEWIDADAELERRAGRTIAEIFAADGEAEFRRRERELLRELLQRARLVLSAGGGAVLHAETRREMREAGPVIWLQADVETLARRMAADPTTRDRRPQLTNLGGLAEIQAVLAVREPLYRETAALTVDTSTRSVEEVVEEILAGLRARGFPSRAPALGGPT
uniref:Shikimate kinase n=1 Tax=Schlesneria paludicola TaxID=360056 RepID=A0A7C4QP64_9PLAN